MQDQEEEAWSLLFSPPDSPCGSNGDPDQEAAATGSDPSLGGWIIPEVFEDEDDPQDAAAATDGMTTVLFATEYDAAEIVAKILANTPTGHFLYPLVIKYQPSDRVRFVLQTQACPDRVRVGPVLVCRREALGLGRYVDRGQAIGAAAIAAALDLPATERLYERALATLARRGTLRRRGGGNGGGGGTTTAVTPELRHVAHFEQQALIAYLHTEFLTPTAPSWFMAAFDPHVGTMLLTMHYYLFEREWSTAQTTRDYTRGFSPDPGPELSPYANMTQLMQALLRSPFVARVPAFLAYARQRNARDHREHEALDELINAYRDPHRLPAGLAVHYVYLAYRRALSAERILEYCRLVEYDPTLPVDQQCRREENFLAKRLRADLLDTMRGYFSFEGYFRDYVTVSRIPGDRETISTLRLAGYGWEPDAAEYQVAEIPAAELRHRLAVLNERAAPYFEPVSTDLSGLLTVCASRRGAPEAAPDRRYQRDALFDRTLPTGSEPLPVFRVELVPGRRHVFYVVARERSWWRALTVPEMRRVLSREYHSDEVLTESVWLPDPAVDVHGPQAHPQLLQTRHEIFNEHLPVFNFVGDMDLHVHEHVAQTGITRRDFFDALRALRLTLVRAWKELFGRVKERSFPVYFYKSACDPPPPATGEDGAGWQARPGVEDDVSDPSEPEDAEAAAADALLAATRDARPGDRALDPDRRVYCRCRDKIGLRVVLPFPRGLVVVGAGNLRRLAGILNHAIVTDPHLFRRLQELVHLDECFDPAVYRHGHSLRLPFMCKRSDDGLQLRRRLLPVFIVPPAARRDPLTFVQQHFEPRNFCHHGGLGPRAVVTEVVDLIEDTGYADRTADTTGTDGGSLLRRLSRPETVDEDEDDVDDDAGSDGAERGAGRRGAPRGFLQHQLRAVTRPRRAPLRDLLRRHLHRSAGWLPDDASAADPDDGDAELGREDDADAPRTLPADELEGFVRFVAWPRLLEHAEEAYRPEVVEQLKEAQVFAAAGRRSVTVRRRAGAGGAPRDFLCLNRQHHGRQENVRVAVSVFANARWELCATLTTRCFAAGCGGNERRVQTTVALPTPQY